MARDAPRNGASSSSKLQITCGIRGHDFKHFDANIIMAWDSKHVMDRLRWKNYLELCELCDEIEEEEKQERNGDK